MQRSDIYEREVTNINITGKSLHQVERFVLHAAVCKRNRVSDNGLFPRGDKREKQSTELTTNHSVCQNGSRFILTLERKRSMYFRLRGYVLFEEDFRRRCVPKILADRPRKGLQTSVHPTPQIYRRDKHTRGAVVVKQTPLRYNDMAST